MNETLQTNGSANGHQMILIEAESDAALLLPPDELRKRFTGRQVEKIERLVGCIVGMLAWGMPEDTIASLAKVSHHTLKTLAFRHAERIGDNALTLADYAQQLSAKCAYHASRKLETASGKDAAIMHGIFRDTAINLRAAAGGGPDLDAALDVESETEAEQKFRAAVQARLQSKLQEEPKQITADKAKLSDSASTTSDSNHANE